MHSRKRSATAGALSAAAALLSLACAQSGGDAPVVVRDSAGITIVENHGSSRIAWRLADSALLSIGAFDGPEAYQLFRVSAALRLDDGGLLVANGGTYELRYFSANGEHVKTVGREGGGPGEFQHLGAVWRFGADSIVTVDQRAGRLSVFHIDGNFGRTLTFPTPPEGGGVIPQGVFADGSLLMLARLTPLGEHGDGMHVDSVEYLRYGASGELLHRLIRRPRATLLLQAFDDGGLVITQPFSPSSGVVVQRHRWYYGGGAAYEIERIAPDGTPTHLYRRSIPNRPVTRAMIDEYRNEDPGENMPPQLREMRRSIEMPVAMPAYRRIRSGPDGTLWVEHYTIAGEQPRFSAFDGEGRYLGDVDVPEGAWVLEIGADYWVVRETDALDVEYVRVYELVREPR